MPFYDRHFDLQLQLLDSREATAHSKLKPFPVLFNAPSYFFEPYIYFKKKIMLWLKNFIENPLIKQKE